MILSCLVSAIIMVESSWNPTAVSPKGAKGLMQLTPIGVQEVVDQYGLNHRPDLYDPEDNIEWGLLLFRHFLKVANGSVRGALHLYNGGYRQFNAYMDGRPITKETAEYVEKVLTEEWKCELERGYEKPWNVELDLSLLGSK